LPYTALYFGLTSPEGFDTKNKLRWRLKPPDPVPDCGSETVIYPLHAAAKISHQTICHEGVLFLNGRSAFVAFLF